jgi:septal ring factor EnvC (AmiA/AmiB activator)
VASACAVPALTGSATGDNVTRLKSRLGNAQSALNSTRQRAHSLQGQIAALNGQVAALSRQIQLVQSREAEARASLDLYESKLAAARAAVGRERHHLRHLHMVLARARHVLATELRGQYEQPQQSVVSLLIDARGFQQLLDSVQYLSDANRQEQAVISETRAARSEARVAAHRLLRLQRHDAAATSAEQTQTDALAGMNALLSSRQSALADEQAAQSAALAATQARGAKLSAAIASIQQQEQRALQAERTISYSNATSTGTGAGSGSGGAGLGSSAGWAIPYAIVLCESGGQNLPPNSAGASGYYQIIPSTWHDFGGSGPAAYLAPKSEQDAVAARIWNGGAGASNWACSAITGVT